LTSLLVHILTGAAVGWLVWYFSPAWLKGK
jgi:hypothetical protein